MDDGPENPEEALAMCRIACDDGIRGMVATPHHGNGVYTNVRTDVCAAVAALNRAVALEGLDLVVYPGAEAHFTDNLPEGILSGEICTLADAGNYVLVELPVQIVPPGLKKMIFQLKLAGITPVIAHPERNRAVQEEIRLLEELVHLGALCQVTAQSVLGDFGARAEQTAHLLIRSRLAHCVASDAHSVRSRPPKLRRALEAAGELLKDDPAFFTFMQECPRRIVQGDQMPEPPVARIPQARSSSFMDRLRSWWKEGRAG